MNDFLHLHDYSALKLLDARSSYLALSRAAVVRPTVDVELSRGLGATSKSLLSSSAMASSRSSRMAGAACRLGDVRVSSFSVSLSHTRGHLKNPKE